jgi:chromosome segregation ATPase
VESRITGIQAAQARIPEFTRGLEMLKKELVAMIDNLEEDRRRADRESARLRLSDVEAQSRSVADLRKRIEVIPDVVDKLETRFVEDRRLSQEVVVLREKLAEISKSMSEWPRRAAYLEEQRLQDTKRIAQLQQEVTELFRRVEPYAGRFEVIDEQVRRAGGEIDEIRGTLPQINERSLQLAERYSKDKADVARQLGEWAETLREHQQGMERYSKEMRTFREANDQTRRLLETLSQLDERLQRESRQVAEGQRLAEERQKSEWERWQEENEKHWARHEMESSRQLAEVQNRLDDLSERIADVGAGLDALYPEIERLWGSFEREAEAVYTAAQERLTFLARQREGQEVR